ncbi:MAG: permease [Spirochaetaceae bacterium]|nr:permease [Spirochaetaceae bacterium]
MKRIMKRYKLIFVALILYGVTFFVNKDLFLTAVNNTWSFLVEMLQVLPPILVISALIAVWVPSKVIRKGLGGQSGIKGKLISLLVGSFSAGPIYAAFPAVLVLFKKGASVSNMVIILSAWAVIKVPMILVETNFLGARFALTRLALTVPAILVMGYIVEKFVKRDEIKEMSDSPESARDILTSLPNLNCKGCGYETCKSFAEAMFEGEKELMDCIILQKQKGDTPVPSE